MACDVVTDEQLIAGAVLGAAGTIVGAIRWGVGRITKSSDDSTAALIAATASNAVLQTKLDAVVASNQRLSDKIDGISDFVEEHTPIGPIPKPRTPARGVRVPRPGTHHDD